MAKKTNLLKNLLTTASALAVLAGGVQTAAAAARTTNGTAALIGAGNANFDAPVVNGDSIILGNIPNAEITTNRNGIIVEGISTAGNVAKLTVTETMSIGSVANGAGGGGALNIDITAAKNVTLSAVAGVGNAAAVVAGDYRSLGTVTFGNAGATLNVKPTAPSDLAFGAGTTLNGSVHGNGVLNVLTGNANTATFNGTIGNVSRLAAVNVGTTDNQAVANGKAVFTLAAKANKFQIGGNGGGANHGGTGGATFNAPDNVANDGFFVGGNANGANNGGNGVVNFANNATLNIANGGLKVGATGAVGAVGVAGTGKIVFGANANLVVSDGGITLGGTGGDGNGGVIGTGGGAVDAATAFGGTVSVGNGQSLIIGGTGGVGQAGGVFAGGAGGASDTVVFSKLVTMNGAGEVRIGGTGGAGGAGGASGNGGNGGNAGAVGGITFEQGLKAGVVKVGGNAGATGGGGGVAGGDGGSGKVIFKAALTNAAGDGPAVVAVGGANVLLGANGGDGTVNFDTTNLNLTEHEANVTFGTAASVVNVGSATTGTVKVIGNFDFANKGATINLGKDSLVKSAIIEGDVLSNLAANGTLKVLGANTQVIGNIGNAAGTGVALIDVGNGVDGKITIAGNVFATDIKVGSVNTHNGEAVFNGPVKTTGALTIGTNAGVGGVGTVSFNSGDSTIVGGTTFDKDGSIMNIGNGTAAEVKVAGNIDFADKAAILNLKGGVVTGVVGNKAIANGAINNGGNAAIINTSGFTQVVGAIGATSKMAEINIGNGAAGNATFGAAVTSSLIKIGIGANNGVASFAALVTAANGIAVGAQGGGNTGTGSATFAGGVASANGIEVGGAASVGHVTFNAATGGPIVGGVRLNNAASTMTVNPGAGNNVQTAVAFGGNDATITFGANGGTLTGAITTANTANTGNIVFDNAGNPAAIVGQIGAAGAGRLNTITTQGAAGTVALGNGLVFAKKLLIKNTSATGIVTLAGALDVGTAVGEGVIFGANTGVLEISGAGGMAAGRVDFNGKENAVLKILAGGGVITGDIDNTILDTVAGTINIGGGFNIIGKVGSTRAIKAMTGVAATNANGAFGVDGNTNNVQTISFGGNAELTVRGELNVYDDTWNVAKGIVFSNAAQSIITNDNINGNIEFANADATVTLANANAILNSKMHSTTAAGGKIIFKGANGTLTGGTDSANGGFGLTNVTFGNAGATTLGFGAPNQTYQSAKFTFGDAASVLNLNQPGTTLIGDIVGAAGGTVDVNEDATIIGQVGNTALVAAVNFVSPNTLTVKSANGAAGLIATKNTDANTAIKFTADGTLKIMATDAQNQTITAKIINPTVDTQAGTIILDASIGAVKTVTFDRLVGDATTGSIKSLEIAAGVGSGVATNFVRFSEGVNIAEIKAAGATNLKFAKNAGIYKIGNISGLDENSNNKNLNLMVDAAKISLLPIGDVLASYGSADKRLGKVKFLGDHELEIYSGVSIYGDTVTSDVAAAGGQGVITFKGNSTFDLKADAASPLKTIKGPDIVGKEAVFVGEAFLKGGNGVIVGLGTMSFGDNITMSETGVPAAKEAIYAAGNNTGTLKFTNQADAVVNIRVTDGGGAGAGLIKNVEFNGAGTVTFNKLFMMSDPTTPSSGLRFTNSNEKNPTIVTFKDATTAIGSMNVDVTAAGAAPTIIIKNQGGVEFLGTRINGEKGVTYNLTEANSANIKINSANTAVASFKAKTANVHTMEMFADGSRIKNLGEDATKFATLTFTDNGFIDGNAYVQDVVVAVGKTATFAGVLGNDRLTLSGNGSKVVFNKEEFILEGDVQGTIGGKGAVEFNGAGKTTVNGRLGVNGSIESVTFIGNDNKSEVMLNKDVAATDINFNNSKVNIKQGNITLDGKSKLANLVLGGQTLTVDGKNNSLALERDVSIETDVSLINGELVGGHIIVSNKASVDYSAVTSAIINLNDGSLNAGKAAGKTFTLIDGSTAIVETKGELRSEVAPQITTDNRFTEWTPVVSDSKGTIAFKLKDISEEVLNKDLVNASVEDRQNITLFKESEGYFLEISNMDAATRVESVQRVVGNDSTIAISNFTGEIANSMSSHVANLAGIQAPGASQRVVDTGAYIGMAAGDDVQRFGAWAAPFLSKSTQKARGSAAGYKAQSGGGSFGFDVKANDDMIVGTAISMVNTDVNHKDYKSGDKTRVQSLMLSIYGMQQITENWFGQAVATFGSNRVTSNEKRVNSNTTSQTANGKYTSMSFAGEALLGYNFSNDMFSVTPMAGVRATRLNDGGYDETGTTNQNLHVTKKASNKFEVMLGARVAAGKFNANGLVITPELHAFVNQDLVAKNAQISMKLPNAVGSLNTKRAKPSRTMFNLGAGVNATYDMMEYGFGYDANISKKYVGHQGTMKVRVNF